MCVDCVSLRCVRGSVVCALRACVACVLGDIDIGDRDGLHGRHVAAAVCRDDGESAGYEPLLALGGLIVLQHLHHAGAQLGDGGGVVGHHTHVTGGGGDSHAEHLGISEAAHKQREDRGRVVNITVTVASCGLVSWWWWNVVEMWWRCGDGVVVMWWRCGGVGLHRVGGGGEAEVEHALLAGGTLRPQHAATGGELTGELSEHPACRARRCDERA